MEELSGRRVLIGAARVAACLALCAGTAACGAPPGPGPRAVAPAPDPLARAREALGRGDHAAAASLLREAVEARPESLDAHYLLAVSASHLDRADEAGREFAWVVAHGGPAAPEVAIARDWLAARSAASPAGPASRAGDGPPAAEPRPDLAEVFGQAVDAGGPKGRLLLFLRGVRGSAVEDEQRSLRTDERGRFRFTDVRPGDYVLTNAVAGPAAWRLRLSVASGERLAIDLSPANDTGVRDDAPEAAR